MRDSYMVAFQLIDKIVASHGLNDPRPLLLHHYTSMDVAHLILANRDLRLSHCEYLNDSDEIKEAVKTVRRTIDSLQQQAALNRREHDFYADVLKGFDHRAALYEAFVFCMSEGDSSLRRSQDVLSFWRGYGRAGKGLCLSFESQVFANFNNQIATECRLNKVIYDDRLQEQIVAHILDEGWQSFNHSPSPNDAVEGTVVALIFIMPTMKHSSFSEEKEWRFIYVPEPNDPVVSKRRFHSSSDGLLIPFYNLSDVLGLPEPKPPLPIKEIMTGPSPYQELNIRALEFIRNNATLRTSAIPYRG